MKKIEKIERCLYLNEHGDRSIRSIAAQEHVSPKFVARVIEIAKKKKVSSDDLRQMSRSQAKEVFYTTRQREKEKRMPDWSYIHQQVQASKNATLMQLWYEYCLIDADTAYSYSQFTHYYRRFTAKVDISMRQKHYPGEIGYVDFAGKPLYYTDTNTKTKVKVQIFVAVLGFSQYTFACAVRSQNEEDWIDCHNQWFQFLERVPNTVTCDNLKAAVIKAGKKPELNKVYYELSRHYRFSIHPARVRKPQDKSLAEIGVLLVTRWITVPLSRREFFSLEEINEAISELLVIINERNFKRYPGNRRERFEKFDKPAMRMCSKKPFEYAKWISKCRVNSDYHVEVDGHFYSVPFDKRNEYVEARVTKSAVQIIHDNQIVATHKRSFVIGASSVIRNHATEDHQYILSQNKQDYLEWAFALGVYSYRLIQSQFEGLPSYSTDAIKASQGLKELAKLYGQEAFEKASWYVCERLKTPTLTRMENVLRTKRYEQEQTELVAPMPEHDNVRGGSYYEGGVYA